MNLTKTINSLSRDWLDYVPNLKGIVFVMDDNATPEDLKSITDQLGFTGGAHSPSVNAPTMLSFACDGYYFHYIKQSDLNGSAKESPGTETPIGSGLA